MAGRILKLEELSSTAFGDLDRAKTAIFIPFSPMEGHGPHLPLGLDFFNAEYFAETAAASVVERMPDFDAVICRGIPLGTQVYNQPGSLRTDNTTIYKIGCDIGKSLAGWGFRFIFIVSGHGSPKDIVALEAAAKKISRKFKIEMHNLSGAMATRLLSGEFIDRISSDLSKPLGDNEKKLLKSDFHGGWWETSMMLLLKPDLVNPVFKTLPDTKGNGNPKPQYYGSPSKATVEFAEASMKVLTKETGDTIVRCLSGENVSEKTTSPLYKVLYLRPNFKRRLTLAILGIIKLFVIIWILRKYLG
ncbi:MAG: creatininase family protein [candidate division Zixibacteria bacterium]